MGLILLSFIAGVLTVLAPCILPLLPIVIGRSTQDDHKWRPYIVSASLGIAVILFTLVLKASTVFINVEPKTWSLISGIIIIFFGLVSLFPGMWQWIEHKFGFANSSNKWLAKASLKNGAFGDVLLGLALGPVFTSCSPTYFLILATVLPQSLLAGTFYLTIYAVGLAGSLLLIGLLGRRLVSKLNLLSDPKGFFKRSLGVLFILVGLFIMSGLDKKVQTAVLDSGYFDITKVEQYILQKSNMNEELDQSSADKQTISYPQYEEIVHPSGFVNADPFELKSIVGKKVILLDFMTYSCINCQRTFPYLNSWYDKYKDAGLEVVGIHTPEFAFEKVQKNVENAAKEFGLEFPLVLDNNYATWKAYGNNFWPRKYLIDIHGNIVYDHIGEGAYDKTESKIQELLKERADVLSATVSISEDMSQPEEAKNVNFDGIKTRETYLGYYRNKDVGIVESSIDDTVTFRAPSDIVPNKVYLVGTWNITGEYAQAVSDDARLLLQYHSKDVYLVMGADGSKNVTVLRDGKPANASNAAGPDIQNGIANIEEETLYRLIEDTNSGSHLLELQIDPGVQLFAFTFG